MIKIVFTMTINKAQGDT